MPFVHFAHQVHSNELGIFFVRWSLGRAYGGLS